jgi:hypothetical protein
MRRLGAAALEQIADAKETPFLRQVDRADVLRDLYQLGR